jgi:hypothetical protein
MMDRVGDFDLDLALGHYGFITTVAAHTPVSDQAYRIRRSGSATVLGVTNFQSITATPILAELDHEYRLERAA